MNNWKLRHSFTGNATSDVQTVNGYLASGEDNDFAVTVVPDGKEYAAPLVVPRTNLVDYSEDFDTASWSKFVFGGASLTLTSGYADPEGSSNAYRFELVVGTGGALLTNEITVVSGADYTLSVWMKGESGGEIVRLALKDKGSDGPSGSVITLTTEWTRYDVTLTADAADRGFQFRLLLNDGASDQTIYVYGAQLEVGNKATEYIPTTTEAVTRSWDSFSRVQNQVPGICNGTHTHTGAASGGGIAATTITGTGSGGKFKYEFDTLGKLTLIEAMTHENLLLQSNTFSTTWTTTNASVTSGESGYDGTNDAWLLQTTASGGRVVQSISTSGVSTYSIYAKAGNVNWIALYAAGSPIPYVYFDLQNGQVGTSVGGNTIDEKIESVGNGWYRCSITANSSINEVRVFVATADNTLSAASGDNIYIQDAQLEAGSQATTYIETTTAPVREGAGQGYKVDDKLSITTNEGHDIEFRLVEGSNAATVSVSMGAAKPNKPIPFPVSKMRVEGLTDCTVLFMDQRSRYVFPKPTPYLLDTYEGAAAAYSLRRLRSSYTGPAVRVRRASNNDELDIYFNRDGSLDTATLEAFCAGTDGFVKVWYDQSGNGLDLTQTSTGAQFKVYDSITGYLGELRQNGSRTYFQNNLATWSQPNSAFMVFNAQASNTNMFDGRSSTDRNVFVNAPSNNRLTIYAGTNLFTTALSNGEYLGSSFFNGSSSSLYIDGAQKVSGDAGTDDWNFGTVGQRYTINTTSNQTESIKELIIYNSDQSSNRTGIESNINDYYSIYP